MSERCGLKGDVGRKVMNLNILYVGKLMDNFSHLMHVLMEDLKETYFSCFDLES